MIDNKSKYLIMAGFVALIARVVVGSSLGIAESVGLVSCVSYLSFLHYVEWRKAKDVQDSYEERLKSLENKLMFLSGGAIINQKRK